VSEVTVFPRRLKIYLTAVLIFIITGYFALVIIEDLGFVDAFYFLIVTVSTVGYGDFAPTTPLSRVIISLLIILSISSIALLSEQIVSRLVSINTQQYLELPREALDYENHIIICGFTNIAENIALMFQTRFFRVIVLDPHAVAVLRARRNGLEAYLAKPQLKANLEQVNISKAMALYLFMDDENSNVLTSLQARSQAGDDLLIYASTEHELSIELGNLIGIDRTYHYERIVAANIRFSLSEIIAFALPNQLLSPRAQFLQILVTKNYEYTQKLDDYYPIGMLDSTLTNFDPIEEISDYKARMENGDLLMVTVLRDQADTALKGLDGVVPAVTTDEKRVDKIIIGGYTDTARHIIHELDDEIIENYHISILTFSKAEAERAVSEGYEVINPRREELEKTLIQVCDKYTLMVNLFERLTDSLLVNTIVNKIEQDVFTVQMAHNRIETDVLIKSGADRVLIPDVLMSRGMLLILMSTRSFMNSMVWSNSHIFEHYVDEDSPLRQKSIKNLKSLGYKPLLYRSKMGNVIEHVDDLVLHEGDNILLMRDHEILMASDQFVDGTH
jgi:voltage-gated potassium channel